MYIKPVCLSICSWQCHVEDCVQDASAPLRPPVQHAPTPPPPQNPDKVTMRHSCLRLSLRSRPAQSLQILQGGLHEMRRGIMRPCPHHVPFPVFPLNPAGCSLLRQDSTYGGSIRATPALARCQAASPWPHSCFLASHKLQPQHSASACWLHRPPPAGPFCPLQAAGCRCGWWCLCGLQQRPADAFPPLSIFSCVRESRPCMEVALAS